MADLRETLGEAVKADAVEKPQAPATPATSESKESSSKDTEEDGSLSKYDKKLLADVDVSKFTSPEARDEFLKARKAYDKAFHKAQAEFAGLKKLRDSMHSLGVTEADLREVVERKATRSPERPVTKADLPESTKEQLRGIDALIAKATDPEVREQLRESKQVITEEATALVERALKPFKDELEALKAQNHASRAQTIDSAINSLEDSGEYPAELIETYRSQMTAFARKYPTLEMEEILFKVVPAKDLRAALRESQKPSSTTGRSAQKAPSVSSAPVAVSEKEAEQFKHPRGGWKIDGLLRHLVAKKA